MDKVQSNRNRRLLLHFDLNNTILMKEQRKGLGFHMNIVHILCKSAWGTITKSEDGEMTWVLGHD